MKKETDMKAKCFLFLGIVIAGSSLVPFWGMWGLIVEVVSLFFLMLEAIKE